MRVRTFSRSVLGSIVVIMLLAIVLVGCGESTSVPTAQPTAQATTAPTDTPTQAPTDTPTQAPTATPTQKLAPIPSSSELSSLFSAKDGQVTDVNVTPNAAGTGVALDIQVYSPTQTKIKHINYILMQFFFGSRNDVSALNFAFHADGYTGMDDPIAQCGGVSSEYKLGYDENQLWDALYGVFNANLPG